MADDVLTWRVTAADPAAREVAMGVAWEGGASGVEERSDGELIIYTPSSITKTLGESLRAAVGNDGSVGAPEPVADVDWTEQLKAGQGPIVISPRLVVRPSFAPHALEPGQREIVIDPGQAFGTGGHQSTRLVLVHVDGLARAGALDGARVLDVGAGSGVLAFAAVTLGAEHALGFDLDPLAEQEARHWAAVNGLEARVAFFTGPIDDLPPAPPWDLVLANLLKREVLPIADAVATQVSDRGQLVLSGLLEADVPEVAAAFAAHGLVETRRESERDANGDLWVSPLLERRG